MATNTKSAEGTSKQLTAAEMRDIYEKNKHAINFAKAEDAIKYLRDATKNSTKTISTFNKETLRGYIRNLNSNEANLRNLSWYLYFRSQVYARLVNFYANMFCLDARSVIPQYDLIKDADKNKILKSYQDTINILDNMRLQQELYNAYLTCFVQDVFYGVVFYDDTGIFIYPFPADYARISGKYMTGDFSYSIDCSYFTRYPELLEWYQEPFKKLNDEYKRTNQKWQPMPAEYSLCLKYRSEDIQTILPVFTPLFEALINLSDLEDIQAVTNEQSIYKLLWMELETLDGTKEPDDWKVDPQLANQYFNKMINNALPEYISAALIPGKLNEISFPNDQATDTSKIASATETVLNTAGGAEVLNGASINNTFAFKLATIQNTEYAISSLLPQTQSWVNRFLATKISNPCKVKFFPISVYTKEDYKDQLLEAAQNGLSTKLAYNTLNGFSEKETLALNFLEEEILELNDKLVPLSTSYTKTGTDGEVGQGRPEIDEDELSDSGERSRNE